MGIRNWSYVTQHMVVAMLLALGCLLVALPLGLPPWLLLAGAAVNALFWHVREIWDHGWCVRPVWRDPQAVAEWLAPAATFLATVVIAWRMI